MLLLLRLPQCGLLLLLLLLSQSAADVVLTLARRTTVVTLRSLDLSLSLTVSLRDHRYPCSALGILRSLGSILGIWLWGKLGTRRDNRSGNVCAVRCDLDWWRTQPLWRAIRCSSWCSRSRR